jgi:hypothetical protein
MYANLKVTTLVLAPIALPVPLAACANYPGIGPVASTA